MRLACPFPIKPFATVALLALGVSFASHAVSAPRLRLKCSVSPRMLPATGGKAAVRVSAGTQQVADLLVTMVRPDRTSATMPLVSLGSGEFSATFDIAPNQTSSLQKYSFKAFARGNETLEATLNCGTVKVKSSGEATPFSVVECRLSPRKLPAAGGTVHVETLVKGKRRGLVVRAQAFGGANVPQVDLTPGPGGAYRGDLVLPANAGDLPFNYNIHVVAQVPGTEDVTGMDCGFVAVDPADTSARTSGIAVAGAFNDVPVIRAFHGTEQTPLGDIFPFGRGGTGTATIAAADLDGDGITDFIAAVSPGAGPHVKVFSGADFEEIHSFFAYDEGFRGGVRVAAGDVNGDGVADIITGAGAGSTGGHVKVFDGRSGAELSSFLAFNPSFTGGVRVAAGDVDGDGRADVVASAGAGGGPHVKVFSGADGSVLRSFFAFEPSFSGGVRVAAGDVNGDGRADIITGVGAGAGPHVRVFDGRTGSTIRDFFAYESSFQGGVVVATGDLDGDGRSDLVTGAGAGAGGGHVKVFSGATGAKVRSFFAFNANFTGEIDVAAWKR